MNAEYRLTFIDESRRPVPGVALRVLTQAGGECPFYPIDEFLPDRTPTSDAEGRMVFHHASEGLEYGGRTHINLLGMQFGDRRPEYVCSFSVAGREMYRVRYDDLLPRGEWGRLPRVTKPWQLPGWPPRKDAANQEERRALSLRRFDGNGDGELDREERTAAVYFDRMSRRFGTNDDKQDFEFLIVERTITVPVP